MSFFRESRVMINLCEITFKMIVFNSTLAAFRYLKMDR